MKVHQNIELIIFIVPQCVQGTRQCYDDYELCFVLKDRLRIRVYIRIIISNFTGQGKINKFLNNTKILKFDIIIN